MDLQLFSIEHAPRVLPIWDAILEDLGRPGADRIGRALGVGRSTVYRWTASGQAPRVACLALFWLTRWGRSAIDAQATNDAVLAVQLARALSEERQQLRADLAEAQHDRQALRAQLAASSTPWSLARPAEPQALAWPTLASVDCGQAVDPPMTGLIRVPLVEEETSPGRHPADGAGGQASAWPASPAWRGAGLPPDPRVTGRGVIHRPGHRGHAGTAASPPPPRPAPQLQQPAQSSGAVVARAGTPPSARPAQPGGLGHAPDPGGLGPPGRAAFDAIARSATTPATPRRTRKP